MFNFSKKAGAPDTPAGELARKHRWVLHYVRKISLWNARRLVFPFEQGDSSSDPCGVQHYFYG